MTSLTRVHNLPAEPNAFIGRDRDVAQLIQLLTDNRMVTLCGVGGIGKSRIALRVAAAAAADYPDGVWLVELADVVRPELIVHALAATVEVPEEGGSPLTATLCAALRNRRLLLVMDNCEPQVEACAALVQVLLAECPGVALISTSREPLRIPGELVWRVPPLELAPPGAPDPASYEAVRLFAERATATGANFAITQENAEAVAGLCRALDGLPLALELAAARISVLSVEQITERLSDRFRLLTMGDRTAPARQRTLRATVDWSYELLSGKERLLLRRLSVFVGGFSLPIAERVCTDEDLPSEEILDLLAGLVDKSLVVYERQVAGQAWYRMLETVRQYAADRLVASGDAPAMRRMHLDAQLTQWEIGHGKGMSADAVPWSRRMEIWQLGQAELANLRAALDWALECNDAARGLRIALMGRSFWVARGRFAEGRHWLERLLELDLSDVPEHVIGHVHTTYGELALGQDDLAAAERAGLQGLELCRGSGNKRVLCTALNLLAMCRMRVGDRTEATAYLTEALSLARELGDRWEEGFALGSLASLHAGEGRLREAQRRAEEALAVLRAIDNQWGVARTLIGLGQIAQARGDLPGARVLFEQAVPSLRQMKARPELARCLAGIARVAIAQADLSLARESLTESLRLSQRSGRRLGVARGLEAFAELVAAEGDLAKAVRLRGAASSLRETAGGGGSGVRQESLLEQARKGLSEPEVDLAWRRGRTMAADDAVAMALEDSGYVLPDVGELPAGPAPGPLTPREREIVALICRGLSNRAIADELVISPATAARHVANILTKLGLRSRTQVAAWAVENEIA